MLGAPAYTGGTPSSANNLEIGAATPDNSYFPGDIDEVAIYSRALSLEEIQAHYYRRKYTNPQPSVSSIGTVETQ